MEKVFAELTKVAWSDGYLTTVEISRVDIRTAALYQNREVLAPLVARLGMPGSDWLLVEEEEFKDPLRGSDKLSRKSRRPAREVRADLAILSEARTEELFDARQAVELLSGVSGTLKELLKSEAARNLFGDLVDTNPEYVLEMLQSFSQLKN